MLCTLGEGAPWVLANSINGCNKPLSSTDRWQASKRRNLRWRTSHQTTVYNWIQRFICQHLLWLWNTFAINQSTVQNCVSFWGLYLARHNCLVRRKILLRELECDNWFRCLIWIVLKTKFSNYIVDPAKQVTVNPTKSVIFKSKEEEQTNVL